MRLALAALALAFALPAAAQSRERDERHIVITTDTSAADGQRIIVRRVERDGAVEADTLRLPPFERIFERVLTELPGRADGAFREAFPAPGVSEATRERMRELERDSRDLAREARAASGRERDRLVERLDGVLAELFEVRAEARREEAAELRRQADALDAGLAERERRRDEILDARRRELLGEADGADW